MELTPKQQEQIDCLNICIEDAKRTISIAQEHIKIIEQETAEIKAKGYIDDKIVGRHYTGSIIDDIINPLDDLDDIPDGTWYGKVGA